MRARESTSKLLSCASATHARSRLRSWCACRKCAGIQHTSDASYASFTFCVWADFFTPCVRVGPGWRIWEPWLADPDPDSDSDEVAVCRSSKDGMSTIAPVYAGTRSSTFVLRRTRSTQWIFSERATSRVAAASPCDSHLPVAFPSAPLPSTPISDDDVAGAAVSIAARNASYAAWRRRASRVPDPATISACTLL